LVEPEDLERVGREIDEALRTPNCNYYSELRVRWADRSIHWLEARGEVRRDSQGKPITMQGTVVDITGRKQAEAALRGAQQRELRSHEEFARQLLEAQEQERQRLAAELHDSLGQNLSVIKNNVVLALGQTGLAPNAAEYLEAISTVASETIADVRDLVRNLRPLQIEQLGLTDSLRELSERILKSTPIQIDLRIENVDDVIKGPAATHLYRIVQEALNNLIKHAQARRAALSLERDIKCVRLRLSDDGRGFEIKPALQSGFGLRNMAERAQMLGSTLNIESTPGTGTKLKIEVPIAVDEEAGGDIDLPNHSAPR
jgi:signal transduction histidine kinase